MRIADCRLARAIFHTPHGWIGVAVSKIGIVRIVLPRKGRKAVGRELASSECALSLVDRGGAKTLEKAVKLLRRYFSGRHVLFDLPLDLRYYTAFRRAVWSAASAIPFGETRSYGWIAKRIGRPDAARAVGQAMGANPVPVIIP